MPHAPMVRGEANKDAAPLGAWIALVCLWRSLSKLDAFLSCRAARLAAASATAFSAAATSAYVPTRVICLGIRSDDGRFGKDGQRGSLL